jgi:hypothetical protein
VHGEEFKRSNGKERVIYRTVTAFSSLLDKLPEFRLSENKRQRFRKHSPKAKSVQ